MNITSIIDIRNAINTGHEVTTHEHNINFHGWKSTGYIIVAPYSGAGAYLISGGANGGFLVFLGIVAAATSLFMIGSAFFAAPGIFAAFLAIGGLSLWWKTWMDFINLPKKLAKMDDDKAYNELNSTVSMMVLGAAGGATFGKLFKGEAYGDLFTLIINDFMLFFVLAGFPWSK